MTRFGPYRLEELLGRGGMGEVWRAYDAAHDRMVAVKVLLESLSADDEYRARFEREARTAANLSEQHVIPIHRYGEIDGRLFIDMRLVEGEDLGHLLDREGALPAARAVDIVEQVAAALDAAHAAGLVHRDVKPANVLLAAVPPGTPDAVYLADFGIATTAAPDADGRITLTGAAVGSPAYMAPERFRGDRIDHRADVYSLGCLLFELITGSRPFPGGDFLMLVYQHASRPPPRPTELRPELPAAVDAVIETALAKDPDQRFASAGALATAARRAVATLADTAPTPRRSTGRWIAAGALAAAAAVTAALLVAAPWRTEPLAGPPPAACGESGTFGLRNNALTIAPDGHRAYAIFAGSDSVTVLDLDRNSTAGCIHVGGSPRSITATPDGRHLYVSRFDGPLAVVDTSTNAVVGTVDVSGVNPRGVAVLTDGRGYATADQRISVFDTATNTVTATIRRRSTFDFGAPVAAPDGRRVYFGDDKGISVLDTASNTVAATIPTSAAGSAPRGMAITPDGRRLVVANSKGSTDATEDTVSIVDTSTASVVATIPMGTLPSSVAITPDGRLAYVTQSYPGKLAVIDIAAARLREALPLPDSSPAGLAITPDGRKAVVTFGRDPFLTFDVPPA
ncbi:protein kinase domain-containing protein [Pseudonocardia sp. CA-107938]|uniref:protein kinase domain-containing protein n=1 Tax=Pseudonocardia sp. CA-107938 TaxID=3240021 RepID=UPI003D89C2FE